MLGTSPTHLEYLVALELRNRRTYAQQWRRSRTVRNTTARRSHRLADALGR